MTAPHHHVVVIGSGFAGIGVSVALQKAGIDHAILEKGSDVGGTWRDNRYPGCQCDVPSHLYSFSFALNPDWSRTYSPQPEIWAYLRDVARRFGVTPRIRFGHEVLDCAWDQDAQLWRIETSQGAFTANAVIAAVGGLSAPALPEIPGLERFQGQLMHSADWQPDASLRGQRVAVIGTGASAIQIVPKVQPDARRLVVFQRTPGWVMPHRERAITHRERRLYRRLPLAQRAVRAGVYWLRELLGFALTRNKVEPIRRAGLQHLARQVPDPALRAKLTPSYSPGCKRLLPSNTYYPALSQPNVELVTEPITEIRERSITTADGREHPVDTLIAATGFKVTDHPFYGRVRGSDGRTLEESWQEGGVQAYRGTTVPGYPNLFLMTGPNTALGHTSVVVMIEAQIPYILGALKYLRSAGAAGVVVKAEAAAAFNQKVQRRLAGSVWNSGGCASWYLDRAGRNPTLWPGSTWTFRRQMRRFDIDAYELIPQKKRGAVPESTGHRPRRKEEWVL